MRQPGAAQTGAGGELATTAPISARPLEIRSPAMKNGSAQGTSIRHSVCARASLFVRKYASSPGSTLRRLIVVLLMIGNSAIAVAHRVRATGVFFTGMMISGATATIGVSRNNTAQGSSPHLDPTSSGGWSANFGSCEPSSDEQSNAHNRSMNRAMGFHLHRGRSERAVAPEPCDCFIPGHRHRWTPDLDLWRNLSRERGRGRDA